MDRRPTTESIHARVGTVLRDKWELGRIIGAGGTAAVYEGTHRTNGRRVAVKIMHGHLASSPDVVARFQREGYIANKVGHPGAVAILDDDRTEDGAPFLVMERLDGAPLTQLFERKKQGLEVGPTLRIAHDMLDILAAAHDKGITHRDIKPDNVFLTVSGAVMILDFGIARLREQSYDDVAPGGPDLTVRIHAQTREGLTLGTPMYMSPEQARARWADVDARSDLWAVGAILFRMLTGKPVRSATNPAEMLLQAMTQRTPRVVDVAPQIPADVAGIVDRALELEKADRWPDATSMQKAVRDAAARFRQPRAPAPLPEASRRSPCLRCPRAPPPRPAPRGEPRATRSSSSPASCSPGSSRSHTPRAPTHEPRAPLVAVATAIAPPTTPTPAPPGEPAPPQAPAVTTVNIDDLPSAPLRRAATASPPHAPPLARHRHPRRSRPASVLDRRH